MRLRAQYLGIVKEAEDIAREEGFPHVSQVLGLLASEDSPNLSELDIDQLRAFAQFVRSRASLRHPYWDDSREPYVEAHEEEFLEYMNGFYGAFASFLLDELKISAEPRPAPERCEGSSN